MKYRRLPPMPLMAGTSSVFCADETSAGSAPSASARAKAMRGHEVEAMGAWLFIDEIIDVALTIDRDVFGLVAGDRHITHQLEQCVQFGRVRVGVFDELE